MERDDTKYVNVQILEWKWDYIVNHCNLDSGDFEVKSVTIKDDKFKNDERHKELRKAAYKASKELRDYEYNIRWS